MDPGAEFKNKQTKNLQKTQPLKKNLHMEGLVKGINFFFPPLSLLEETNDLAATLYVSGQHLRDVWMVQNGAVASLMNDVKIWFS